MRGPEMVSEFFLTVTIFVTVVKRCLQTVGLSEFSLLLFIVTQNLLVLFLYFCVILLFSHSLCPAACTTQRRLEKIKSILEKYSDNGKSPQGTAHQYTTVHVRACVRIEQVRWWTRHATCASNVLLRDVNVLRGMWRALYVRAAIHDTEPYKVPLYKKNWLHPFLTWPVHYYQYFYFLHCYEFYTRVRTHWWNIIGWLIEIMKLFFSPVR